MKTTTVLRGCVPQGGRGNLHVSHVSKVYFSCRMLQETFFHISLLGNVVKHRGQCISPKGFFIIPLFGTIEETFLYISLWEMQMETFPECEGSIFQKDDFKPFPIKICTFGCLLEKISCQFLWCPKCFYLHVGPSLYVQQRL